ncbi:LOW QUALITY PROTEIN: rab11 family-interacting protein 1-like [Lethenteron reissneri]|uniref:LOW QUALITY PROTEIN: rab11 family-interacting protein 1-like n=1 Tax=Lethenteron reissneri TaxID=7753 RepID=UPI002AB6699D|nr:LOW QUALITY PROTEIN: rab11 family-interacting protein 1-like [Lethenteron reissneri]
MSSGSLEEQAAQRWCPTHVQITVLQARGLRAKGKNGTNDAFAVMELGRERYATSVLEKSSNPEWKEECSFELPPDALVGDGVPGGGHRQELQSCVVVVSVMHRSLLGPDKFLGQVSVSISELYVDKSRRKPEWYKLHSKAGKKEKDRGEVQLSAHFMRNNLTASMFDLSARDKPRSAFGKFKDKVKGKKKGSTSDSSSAIVPGVLRIDSENEDEDVEREEEVKKKAKGRSFLTLPGMKRTSVTHSSSSSLSSSHVSIPSTPDPSLPPLGLPSSGPGAGVGVTTVITPPPVELAPEQDMTGSVGRRRTQSADITMALPVKEERNLFGGLKPKSETASKSSLCINGSHLYVPEKGAAATVGQNQAQPKPNIALSRSLQNINNAEEQKPSIQKTASVGKADAVKAGFFGDKKAGSDKVLESTSLPEPGKDGMHKESRRSLDLSKGVGLDLFDKVKAKEVDEGKKEDGKKSRLNIKSFVTGSNKSESASRSSSGQNLAEELAHGTTFGFHRDHKDKVVKVRLDVSPEVETTNLPQSPSMSDNSPLAVAAAPAVPFPLCPPLTPVHSPTSPSSPMSIISHPPSTPPSILSQSPPTPASLLSFTDIAEVPKSPPAPMPAPRPSPHAENRAVIAPGSPVRENNLSNAAAAFARDDLVSPPPPPSSPEKVSTKSSNPFFFPSSAKNPFLSSHSFNPFLDVLCEGSEAQASQAPTVVREGDATERAPKTDEAKIRGLENEKSSAHKKDIQHEGGKDYMTGSKEDSVKLSDLETGKVDKLVTQDLSPGSSQMQATGPPQSARLRPMPTIGRIEKQENVGPPLKADDVVLAQTARQDDPIHQKTQMQSFSDLILGKGKVSSPIRSPLFLQGVEENDQQRSGTGKSCSEEQPTKNVPVQQEKTPAQLVDAIASTNITPGLQPNRLDKSTTKMYSEVEGADLESSLKINYLDQDETSYYPVKSQLYRPHFYSASTLRSDAAETSPPYLQLSVAEEDFEKGSRRTSPSQFQPKSPEEASTDTSLIGARGASSSRTASGFPERGAELPVKNSDTQPCILNIEVTTQPARKYSSQPLDTASKKNEESSRSGSTLFQSSSTLAEWLEAKHAQAMKKSEESLSGTTKGSSLADELDVSTLKQPRKDDNPSSLHEGITDDGLFVRTFTTRATNLESKGSGKMDNEALSGKNLVPSGSSALSPTDGAGSKTFSPDTFKPINNLEKIDKASSSTTPADVGSEEPPPDVAGATERDAALQSTSKRLHSVDTASRVTSPSAPPPSPGFVPALAEPCTLHPIAHDSVPAPVGRPVMPFTAAREFGPSGDVGWHSRREKGPPSSSSPLVSASETRPGCSEPQGCDAGISPRSVPPLNASGKKMEDDVKTFPAATHKDGGPAANASSSAVLSRLSHAELVALVTRQQAELVRRDDTIRNLHEYIDGLLLRIMEETPHLLLVPYQRAATLGQK